MLLVGPDPMRKIWTIGAGLILLAMLVFALTGTPLFGRRLVLRNAPVSSIELSMFTRREITGSNACAEVLRTMSHARNGGPVHACPCVGTIVIHYADGTTNRFDFLPGHRINRLDLVDITGSGMYSISAGKMYGTLRNVGLLTKDR